MRLSDNLYYISILAGRFCSKCNESELPMANVRLNDVTKVFDGKVVALDNISLDIEDKEFVVLVGPSGCGKSTTLRLIAGLEEVTQGDIYIDDKLVNDVPPKDRDIAMVFQNYALYPHMTVYKNMAFGLMLRKYPKEEIKRRVHEAAEILDIAHLLDRKPRALSGGQRQRVAVGRAIVRHPKVFLFDEPLSNLDAKLRVQMRGEIIKLHQQLQSTVIYVTHDQVEALTMGDRVVVMKDGVVQQIDGPLELYENPKNMFVAGFIGSPPMNFLNGTLRTQDSRFYFDEGEFSVVIPQSMEGALSNHADKKVVMGVRPEGFLDTEGSDQGEEEGAISAIVDVIEPIGPEIHVYMKTQSNTFVVRLAAHRRVVEGDREFFHIDMAKTHFFDPETEQVIV